MSDYLQEILNKTKDSKDYQWLEKYKGECHKKHKIKHLLCKTEYEVRPNDFQQGRRCPVCFGRKNINYLNDLLDKRQDGKEYEWQEDYKGRNSIKHKIKHLVCNNEYEVTPQVFNKGCKCPYCSGHKVINYLEKLKENRKDGDEYEWQEEYKGSYKLKHKIKHLICGQKYKVTPDLFIKGNKCPYCKQLKKDNYLNKLLLKAKDGKEYQWLDDYKGKNNIKHKIKHLVCGSINNVTPHNFQEGCRCPKCSKKQFSRGEKSLLKYIQKLYKDKLISNDKSILKKHEIDIYLPKLKLAFEFNGLYWHSEKGSRGRCDRNYHKNKLEECHNKGVRLIQIWENEWKHPKKKKIIKSKIKYLLNQIKPEKRIYARKCYIKEISTSKCNNFLNNNHIQGKSSKYLKCYGLFYKETKKLVAVMTFAQGNANRGSDDIELSRYTTKKFHNIIGGFSKMLSFAIKENNFKEIYSYADLRLSDGNLYESNGWKMIKYVSPDYYYTDSKDVFHKSLFKKSNIKTKLPEVYDETLTEKQMMEKTKYLRIWDCGKVKYKYNTRG
jgi:hypothetical protein